MNTEQKHIDLINQLINQNHLFAKHYNYHSSHAKKVSESLHEKLNNIRNTQTLSKSNSFAPNFGDQTKVVH